MMYTQDLKKLTNMGEVVHQRTGMNVSVGLLEDMPFCRNRQEAGPNLLLLDAGDQFNGSLWFNYYKGNATSYFMNKVQYDAMVSLLACVNFPKFTLSAKVDVVFF